MSRKHHKVNENIDVYYGSCHPVGYFFDVTDKRVAGTEHDEQGEGYVVEHWSGSGFAQNKIGITREAMEVDELLIELCDAYCRKLKLIK